MNLRGIEQYPEFRDPLTKPVEQDLWDHVAQTITDLDNAPSPALSNRTLVMGFATDYTAAAIRPFVCSLRECGYDRDIILWVSELDSETRMFLDAHAVQYEYFWEMGFSPLHLFLSRFFCYYRLLRSWAYSNRYFDKILITDVRDVVFQRDPFLAAPPGDVVFFLENRARTLGSCEWNSNWLRSGFGDELFECLRDCRISCAGTVLGTWTGILRYLLLMQLTTFECAPAARLLWGIDQGVHNVIVHRNRLRGATLSENADHVFTLEYVPPSEVIITADRKIADLRGRVPPVIHQYDRHPALVELVNRLYGEAYRSAPD